MNYTPQGYEFWVARSPEDKHRDWKYDTNSWLADYILSADHPHRKAIMDMLEWCEPYTSLLELGCNTGPNLVNVIGKRLAGIDANPEAIKYARSLLQWADLKTGNFKKIPWGDKTFDIILADASLMYINPDEIDGMMSEIDRVAKKGVVIVDRFNPSLKGEVTGYVWGRNYPEILWRMGYTVKVIPITKDLWPESENWSKFGIITAAVR